jgi:hypothetical protein
MRERFSNITRFIIRCKGFSSFFEDSGFFSLRYIQWKYVLCRTVLAELWVFRYVILSFTHHHQFLDMVTKYHKMYSFILPIAVYASQHQNHQFHMKNWQYNFLIFTTFICVMPRPSTQLSIVKTKLACLRILSFNPWTKSTMGVTGSSKEPDYQHFCDS